MSLLLPELVFQSASRTPDATALVDRDHTLAYAQLAAQMRAFANGLIHCGLQRAERVGIYLPKQLENVVAMFGTAAAGCTFVPVNPVLKAPQVGYILRD